MPDIQTDIPASDMAPPTGERRVGFSARAAARVAALIEREGRGDLMLRLAVSGGGCSGFQYAFSFDDERLDDDHAFERDGVTLLVDPVSLDFLAGAEVDFVEDLAGSAFRVVNPNAASSCGCGTSFAI